MKRWNTRVLGAVILLAALTSSLYATAQGARRLPTAEERAVVERYKQVVFKALQPVANTDWEEDSSGDYDIPDDFLVTPRPDVPFEITGSIQRSYHVPTDSPYYQRTIAPMLAKMQGMTDPQAMQELFAHVDRTELTITMQMNWLDAIYEDGTRPRVLQVPGAAMAWETPETRQKSVTLLFGDWAKATQEKGGLHYHFRRPGKYLAIENLFVQLVGNGPRIDELLKTIDWKQMNAALYPAPAN